MIKNECMIDDSEMDEMLNSACMDKNKMHDTERDEMFLR